MLNVDPDSQRLSLGLKQLATDIWDDFFANNKVGDVVEYETPTGAKLKVEIVTIGE